MPAYFPRGADAVSEHDPRIFEEETKRSFVEQPERILDYLKKNITFHAEEEYDTIMATPVGVLTMKQEVLWRRRFCLWQSAGVSM